MPILDDRQSEIDGRILTRREEEQLRPHPKSALRLPLIIIILCVGVLIYFQKPLERFLNENLAPVINGGDSLVEAPESTAEYYLPEAGREGAEVSAATADNPDTGNQAGAETPAETVTVSVRTFRPVELEVHAISNEITLAADPTYVVDVLPAELTPEQLDTALFGSIYLREPGMIGVLFVKNDDVHLLYMDRNMNANFSDDGEPFSASAKAFEVTLSLPLEGLSGVSGLTGDYRLWIYRPPVEKEVLRYYPFTQLQGEVEIEGQKYGAVFAENTSIDGDFTNDGIYIDWNRDNFFDTEKEYIRPGKTLMLGERNYGFEFSD